MYDDWLIIVFCCKKCTQVSLFVFHLASEIESDFPFARKKKKKKSKTSLSAFFISYIS